MKYAKQIQVSKCQSSKDSNFSTFKISQLQTSIASKFEKHVQSSNLSKLRNYKLKTLKNVGTRISNTNQDFGFSDLHK